MSKVNIHIKECPFCGGMAQHNGGGNSVFGRLWWAVWCNECKFEFRDREVWDADNPGMLDPLVLPMECFEKWNRRSKPDSGEERARCVDLVERLWPEADDLIDAIKGVIREESTPAPEGGSIPTFDPVDDDWMEPTALLKFVKNDAGHRFLHQMWRGRSSLKSEWRQVPEEMEV